MLSELKLIIFFFSTPVSPEVMVTTQSMSVTPVPTAELGKFLDETVIASVSFILPFNTRLKTQRYQIRIRIMAR